MRGFGIFIWERGSFSDMALEQRLDVKLMQKLVLTPQLQQAIKLLQMPQLELAATLNNEMIENPFLEEEQVEIEPEGSLLAKEIESVPASEEEAETPLERLLNYTADDYFDSAASREWHGVQKWDG